MIGGTRLQRTIPFPTVSPVHNVVWGENPGENPDVPQVKSNLSADEWAIY